MTKRIISVLSCSLLLLLAYSNTALASRSTIENDLLIVPRIDVDGLGSLELTFRIVFDNEYLLVLESANETSTAISNSGVFNPADLQIEVDEVELQSGDLYSVTLGLVSQDGSYVFNLVEAVHLNPGPSQPSSPSAPTESNGVYLTQCSSCHGTDGNGTAVGPSLTACANCGSSSALAAYIRDTMPLGQPATCDIDCANELAGYILAVFNASNEQVANQTVGFIQLLDNNATLRRASEQLASRLPTLQEYQLISSAGETGLRQAIQGLMNEEAFYDRLTEIWNDYLLTDKYHSRNGSEAAISLLSSDDYPNRRWFDPDKDNRAENYNEIRAYTNNGVAREPLELINHVVKNGRPFHEILTANYMMVNPYSAQTYGILGFPFNNPDDPDEWAPVVLGDLPHAGILTSAMFLNRYPTTSTNRNRARARVVFDLFLDTDILAIEGVRPGNSVDITTPIPTINNPECAKCHSILDPVASIFQNWDYKGRYRPARLSRDGWYTDMEPRGFNGEIMPLAGNVDSSLQWLAQQIATDPKFPRAVMRIMVNGLTGKEPLRAPAATASQAEIDAYIAERTLLNDIQTSFVTDNFNLKTLVQEVMMSPYWRAAGLTTGASTEAHALTGASYLLSPEQLSRKVENLLGFEWRRSMDSYYKDVGNSWSDQLGRTFHQIYGGIDSDSVTERLKSPNGLMGAMQLRMANELSCYAVPHDFWLPDAQRRLFLFVDHDSNPYDEAGQLDAGVMDLVRQNIQYLHHYLLGESLALDAQELQLTEALFLNVLNRGRQIILASGGEWHDVRLPGDCDRTVDLQGNELQEVNGVDQRLQKDYQYIIRAWMAVVAYLLADYKFFYS